MKLDKSKSKMVYKLFELNGEPSSKTKYSVQAIAQMYHEEKIKNSNFISSSKCKLQNVPFA